MTQEQILAGTGINENLLDWKTISRKEYRIDGHNRITVKTVICNSVEGNECYFFYITTSYKREEKWDTGQRRSPTQQFDGKFTIGWKKADVDKAIADGELEEKFWRLVYLFKQCSNTYTSFRDMNDWKRFVEILRPNYQWPITEQQKAMLKEYKETKDMIEFFHSSGNADRATQLANHSLSLRRQYTANYGDFPNDEEIVKLLA